MLERPEDRTYEPHEHRTGRRDDRRERRAGHAHVESEYEQGIEADVERRRHQHDVHRLRRVPHAAQRRVDGVGREHERQTVEVDAPVRDCVAVHVRVVRHEPDDERDDQQPDNGHDDRERELEQQGLADDVPGRFILALAVPARDEGHGPRPDDLIGRTQYPRDRPEHRQRGDVSRAEAPDPVDVGQGIDGHRPETDHRGDAHVEDVLENVSVCDVYRGSIGHGAVRAPARCPPEKRLSDCDSRTRRA